MKNLNKNRVCISRQTYYDKDDIKTIVLHHIEKLGGIDRLLSKGKKVVIKPNLVMRKSPDYAATTHPTLVQAVCEIFVSAGADVVIAESSGGLYNPAVMGANYKGCKIAEAAQNSGAKLHTDYGETTVFRSENKICKSFSIINPIANADLIVNLCKLKTHTIATLSGAVKNMFGVIPGIQKVELHSRYPEIEDFCDMLVDLNQTVTCGLCIMDFFKWDICNCRRSYIKSVRRKRTQNCSQMNFCSGCRADSLHTLYCIHNTKTASDGLV